MSVKIVKSIPLGDMQARYLVDEDTKAVELMLLAEGLEPVAWDKKKQNIDSLVQLHLTGDMYTSGYAAGNTLRQGETVERLAYKEQQVLPLPDGGREIITWLSDARGYELAHHLRWQVGGKALTCWTEFFNRSESPAGLELLSSFSIGGLTPYTGGDAHNTLCIHRIRSVWSMEGRLQSERVEDMQLEPSWTNHAIRCERFGQIGSMPVNRWFPWVVVEDTVNHVFWGAQIAHNASWQMELFRKDEGLAISGGLADREFGHWMKEVLPGDSFATPKAILTVCHGGTVDDTAQRLTSAHAAAVDAGPEPEQDLPVIFNEYCTTWGCPSQENIEAILEVIKDKGLAYFVIDCGWYKEDGVSWGISMGDYNISPTLFPQGLEYTVQAIRDAGMIPGIWFEIENVGSASHAYRLEEHLLKRDNKTLATTGRRFWDMCDPWVQDYLHCKVIDLLKEYGFGYIKMDYNDSIGVGCDGYESLGEGLRRNMEASFAFMERMKKELPGLIVENCASGGHRLEPKMLGATAMSSFSDAHECEEIPIIAANLHRVMLPRQSQIWAVIRKTDTVKRIAYSIANTFLGRMCLSGSVIELTAEQWRVIEDGIAFYKKIAPIIRDGHTYWHGPKISSYRHPQGWQGILRVQPEGDAFLVLHMFNGALPGEIQVPLPDGSHYMVQGTYDVCGAKPALEGNAVIWSPKENMSSAAVYLKMV